MLVCKMHCGLALYDIALSFAALLLTLLLLPFTVLPLLIVRLLFSEIGIRPCDGETAGKGS